MASTQPAVERRSNPIRVAVFALALIFTAAGAQLAVADALLASARNRLAAGDATGGMERYESYRHWSAPGPAADLWYAQTLLASANSAASLPLRIQIVGAAGTAALRATRGEDPFTAWYTVAALYALQNDANRSEDSLRSAIAASPNWFKPHWVLSQLLAQQGRLAEAAQEAATALDLDGGKHAEVRATFDAIHRADSSSRFQK
jgi:tetratricopeptide (TPR) repeat protein